MLASFLQNQKKIKNEKEINGSDILTVGPFSKKTSIQNVVYYRIDIGTLTRFQPTFSTKGKKNVSPHLDS
jgi:hypothetical protein